MKKKEFIEKYNPRLLRVKGGEFDIHACFAKDLDSLLESAVASERKKTKEKCAKIVETGNFKYEAYDYRLFGEIAKAIK